MRKEIAITLLALSVAAAATAQQRDTTRAVRNTLQQTGARPAPPASRNVATRTPPTGTPHYDVVLEVPDLHVDSIVLKVDSLTARVSLNAKVADLVRLSAGADVRIDKVELRVEGVLAEVYLYVDLDNVAKVVDRVVTTLENNPEIVTGLLATVDQTVNTVGDVANQALRPGGPVTRTLDAVGQTVNNLTRPDGLLSQTVNTLGQTLLRTVDTTGRLVEHTIDTAGKVVGTRGLGSITSLPLVRETTNTAGQAVKVVRDTSGKLIEYVAGTAGQITGARIIQ
jgi:hypothetical protein